MKKLFFLSATVILLSMAACSKNQNLTGKPTPSDSEPATRSVDDEYPLDQITVIGGTFTNDPDFPTFFDDLTQYAIYITSPPNRPSLPKKYYWGTTTFLAKVKVAAPAGSGSFTFNVVCSDTAGITFLPTIATASGNTSKVTISNISESGSFTPSASGGAYAGIEINFTVTYYIGTTKHSDDYTISGVASQTPVTALLQQIIYGNFSSSYNPQNIAP